MSRIKDTQAQELFIKMGWLIIELLLFEYLFPLKLVLTFAVVALRNGHFDSSLCH